jgi:glycogen debranching enzyme
MVTQDGLESMKHLQRDAGTNGNSIFRARLLGVVVMCCLLFGGAVGLPAQNSASSPSWLRPVAGFPLSDDPITLRQHAEAEKPFTVAGECGAMMGQQNGSFESWIFPVKLFSHMTIEAHVDGYDVPIDVNRDAAEIEVSPDHTTITYAHIAFTLKEILFAPQCEKQDGTGVMALFQVEAIRPLTLTFSFTPEVKPMWPAPISGSVDPEWVKLNDHSGEAINDTTLPGGKSAEYPAGWYMLHTDFDTLAGAIAMPGSEPGILAPYQEKPEIYPLQFVLRIDPRRDAGKYFPLLMAVGTTKESATEQALAEKLKSLNENAAMLYHQNADYYAHFFDTRTTAETPDSAFDRDLKWAAISINQVRVRHGSELGLVAGFYSSGSSARPGFGWFFGRDTLFTTWGINSYGDYKLTREALTFLIKRQRDDGKMPHEYSQTAEQVDWANLPYEYAAADGTPLFLMAMEDYVKASGDTAFLKENWAAVSKAWQFESTHDSDGDGIYDNAQGTGWVESWPQGMPHQEIYLASLDQQASNAMADLCTLTEHTDVANAAQQRSSAIAAKILSEYTQPDGMYAFSHNADGSADKTASIYPAIAWWGDASALSELPKSDAMFSRWASHEFSTDWGTRDVGEHEAVYDPISYHQGSVWPLFTGWASLAEYRSGRDLAGYQHLMQNTNLTTEQDLGAVTELLSGAYYDPFGRSTSHQMWSSAMVLTPAIRGLFGVSVDAIHGLVTVDPHLPAQWPGATLHHLQVGSESVDLRYERSGAMMIVKLLQAAGSPRLKLASTAEGERNSGAGEIQIPLPAVEVGVASDAENTLPLPGSPTTGLKVLREIYSRTSLMLVLEAPAGSTQQMTLRRNAARLRVSAENAMLAEDRLKVNFPAGEGYQQRTVTLHW